MRIFRKWLGNHFGLMGFTSFDFLQYKVQWSDIVRYITLLFTFRGIEDTLGPLIHFATYVEKEVLVWTGESGGEVN